MRFDANEDIILKSVVVDCRIAGQREFILGKQDATKTPIDEPILYVTDVYLNAGLNTVKLDYLINKGDMYYLALMKDTLDYITDVWRATDGATSYYKGYPDKAGDIITFVSNNFSENPPSTPKQWYNAYDWVVQRQACDLSILNGVNSLSSDAVLVDAYPNPSNGLVQLKVNLEKVANLNVTVYNVLGAAVTSKKYDTAIKTLDTYLDLTIYPKGVYFIQVSTSNGESTVKKVVVE
jgi:hypothetical protein